MTQLTLKTIEQNDNVGMFSTASMETPKANLKNS